jgi:hypothetical protein
MPSVQKDFMIMMMMMMMMMMNAFFLYSATSNNAVSPVQYNYTVYAINHTTPQSK